MYKIIIIIIIIIMHYREITFIFRMFILYSWQLIW